MPPRLRLPRPPSSRLSSNIWCRSTECGRVRGLCRAFDRPDIAEVTPNSAEALAKGWPECGSPAQKSMQLPPAGFPTFGSENATAVQSGDGDGAGGSGIDCSYTFTLSRSIDIPSSASTYSILRKPRAGLCPACSAPIRRDFIFAVLRSHHRMTSNLYMVKSKTNFANLVRYHKLGQVQYVIFLFQ